MLIKLAEYVLAAGLVCATLGAGLCQFVLVGLIGVALLLVAFFLLLAAGMLAWSPGNVPLWRRGAGLALFIVGELLLLATGSYASSLAFDAALSSRPGVSAPTIIEWALVGLFSLLPALAIALGLRFRTQWSWSRCAVWGAAAWCVWLGGVIVFWVFTPYLPLTA